VARGACLISPARLDLAMPRPDGAWHLRLWHDGRAIEHRTSFVVDASGRRAALASRLGMRRQRLDGMVALAARVPGTGSTLGMLSLIEATAEGWWYAAPLPGGTVVVSLMTDHDIAHAAGIARSDTFRSAWAATHELAYRVPPPLRLPATVSIFPAHTQYAERAAGRGWLSVGDALLALDPLTSSGITGALDDACAAAATICTWLGSMRESDRIEAASAHARRATSTLHRYLAERRKIYAAEQRWADRPFWRRRTTAGEPSPAMTPPLPGRTH
jgi:flavin-dependent dehydrogenase